MKLFYITLLSATIAFHIVSARNLVKRDCCSETECESSCSSQSCIDNCQRQPCNNCRRQPCNNCRRQPCNNCQKQSCEDRGCNQRRDCNGECNSHEDPYPPVLIPIPGEDRPQVQPAVSSIDNTNVNNGTTTITMMNTVRNVNNISVPINVNSTNENTVSVHFEPSGWRSDDNITSECCLVTSNADCDDEQKNCTVEKRWECSDICKGIFPIEQVSTRTPKPLVINRTVPVYQPQYQVIYQPVNIPPQPMVVRQPEIQQPVFYQQTIPQQPVMVQQPMFFQQPVPQQLVQQPVYQPVPSYPVYSRQVQPQVVPQQVPMYQRLIQTNQRALSRVLVQPYENYFGPSNYQVAEGPCPYSNAVNIGYAGPSPCEQTSRLA